MSHENRFEYDPTATSKRFSFADPSIGRKDGSVYDTSLYTAVHRAVEYSRPSPEQLRIRDAVGKVGLLLGSRDPHLSDDDIEAFLIPKGARPFVYDRAVSRLPGIYGYGDDRLFRDLGSMLRDLAEVGGSQDQSAVLEGPVGPHIAKVAFARSNEKKLLFVPGFEHKTQIVDIDNDISSEVLIKYVYSLRGELGERFIQNIDSFAGGFERTDW